MLISGKGIFVQRGVGGGVGGDVGRINYSIQTEELITRKPLVHRTALKPIDNRFE